MDAAARAYESREIEHLEKNHVVGEEVNVAHGRRAEALLPPLLESQAEDERVDKEEEDDGNEGEDVDDDSGKCGAVALMGVITK